MPKITKHAKDNIVRHILIVFLHQQHEYQLLAKNLISMVCIVSLQNLRKLDKKKKTLSKKLIKQELD